MLLSPKSLDIASGGLKFGALHKGEAQQEFQSILDRFLPSFDRVAPEISTYAVVSSLAWLGRGDEAVAALRKSIARGWNQEVSLLDWISLGTSGDPAVEPIRERADFQELIAQVRERNFLEFERVKASGRPLIPEIAPKAAAGAAAGH